MAHSALPRHFRNGFQELHNEPHWTPRDEDDEGEEIHYELPPSVELVTSPRHNHLGINVLRTWPTMYDGTASPHGVPEWWKPSSKVDVLICGAGPSGLEIALSLLRQGLTFRIIDKAPTPLIAGRADGVQPRFLETLSTWGLASEVQEEGPLIERTAIYYNGKPLHHGRSHQSDSRYRGLHIITQGQIERIFIRDLLRHKILVERNTTLNEFTVDQNLAKQSSVSAYPVRGVIENSLTGKEEKIEAKFLVGSDGASSSIRRRLDIPFDGISTDIYWGIMDCVFETDYPHAWIFGSVVSSKYGGCVIIPRENGYIRLYTQLDISKTGPLSQTRQARDASFAESGGQVDIHSITPMEVLEQANRIFAPYKLSFGAPLSWFAVWKISERVARSFSSNDLRVHLVGDAAHVHSVMGAFGLNASILDAANLAWKLGMTVKNQARMDALLPTYDRERRLHAAHIIETSGKYLRFVCSSPLSAARLYHAGADLGIDEMEEFERITGHPNSDSRPAIGHGQTNGHKVNGQATSGFPSTASGTDEEANGDGETSAEKISFKSSEDAKEFIYDFFRRHGQFLLGVDAPYGVSCLNTGVNKVEWQKFPPVQVRNGVRAPNPRLCFDEKHTGYLYDKLEGASRFHLVVFGWDLLGTVRKQLGRLSKALSPADPDSFYWKYGGSKLFNIVLVAKGTPWEIKEALAKDNELLALQEKAVVLSDDRAPDEDAHNTWGVHHRTGAMVVVRPDLWVGFSAAPGEVEKFAEYFGTFLVAQDNVSF